jgi:hypothetical protein
MLKKIRKGVFETNSSSMHSVCISGTDRYTNFQNDTISVYTDEYGWGYDKLTSTQEKLSYVITAMQYYDGVGEVDDLSKSTYFQWLKEMVSDYSGCELEVLGKDMGYIDHQSTDMLDEYWSQNEDEFKSNMKDLIFNNKYTIIIDNDNH